MEVKNVIKSYRPCVPFLVTLDCVCGGMYQRNHDGFIIDNKIPHVCNKCGAEVYADGEYPYTEFETVGKGPTSYENEIVYVNTEV